MKELFQDSVSPIVYTGTNILVNKQGLKNQKELNRVEATATSFRAMEMMFAPALLGITLGVAVVFFSLRTRWMFSETEFKR
jgi:hypothetical protein